MRVVLLFGSFVRFYLVFFFVWEQRELFLFRGFFVFVLSLFIELFDFLYFRGLCGLIV